MALSQLDFTNLAGHSAMLKIDLSQYSYEVISEVKFDVNL